MIITSLIENTLKTDKQELASEHGLSLHIQHNGNKILFDTGVSGRYAGNAEKMGLRLNEITCGIISHHHYDHGGGLKTFFKTSPEARLHLAEPASKKLKYRALGLLKKNIGLPWDLLDKHTERLVFLNDSPKEILPDVFLSPVTVHNHPKPKGNRHLFMVQDGRLVRDDFSHELIMTIRTGEGLIIFSGCSHNGILNMIESTQALFPGEPIKAIIGGFHLMDSPILGNMAGTPEDVQKLGQAILAHDPDMVLTGHCTGIKAYSILKQVMGDRLDMLSTGTIVTL